jgi:hypothetical protein
MVETEALIRGMVVNTNGMYDIGHGVQNLLPDK